MPSISTWAESQSGQTDERVKITVNFTVSQDASANTSTITIGKIQCYYNYDYYTGKSFYIDGTITVNGTRVFKSNYKTPQATVSATSFETHTISGGERNNTITVAHDSSGKATLTFVFANYNSNCSGFGGVNGSYSNYQFFVRDSSDKTKTYTLPTISQSVKVSYNANGGTGSTASQTTTKNATITLRNNGFTPPSGNKYSVTLDAKGGTAPTPTYSGNEFYQWRLNSTSGTAYAAGASYKVTAAATFYAQWRTKVVYGTPTRANTTANGYKVTFNANGGSCSTASLTAKNTTKYTFSNWNTASDGSGTSQNATSTYKLTSNTTRYAQWTSSTTKGSVKTPTPTNSTATTITTTFNYQGATGGNSTTSLTSTKTVSKAFKFWGTSTSATSGTAAGANYKPSAATTLYAIWDTATTSYTSITLPTPTKTGYTFKGWATSATATSGSTGSYKPTSSATLYAVWENNTFTLTLNKGTGISKVTGAGSKTGGASVTIGATVDAGYTWKNWTSGTSTTQVSDKQSYTFNMPKADTTYKANATANKYTVSFNANGGGTPSSESIEVTYNSTYGTLPTISRTGYTFNGWFTSASGGTQITADTTVKITANQTLYAHWTINSYKLYVYPQGGTWEGSTSNQTITLNYNKTRAMPVPTRTGYQFGGWATSAYGSLSNTSFSQGAILSSSHSLQVYDNKSSGTVTMTWVDNSAGDTPSLFGKDYVTITKTTGTAGPGLGGFRRTVTPVAGATYYHVIYAKIPKGYTIQKTNNTLSGTFTWLTDQAGTGDWKIYAYKLVVNSSPANLGAFGFIYLTADNGSTTSAVTWYVGANQITQSPASAQTFTMKAGASYLYAMWIPNKYTVTYNANGGTGTMSNSTHYYAYSKALNKNTFSRIGYEFLGWSTSSTATTQTYTDQQSVLSLTSTNGGTINLFAVWKPIARMYIAVKNPTTGKLEFKPAEKFIYSAIVTASVQLYDDYSGTEYAGPITYEVGQTWSQWCDSRYNTHGLYCSGNYVYGPGGTQLWNMSGNAALSSDVITSTGYEFV